MMKQSFKNDSGQSVAEFALILPVFLLIVLATLSLGLMIYAKMLVVISSSEAAKVGAEIYNDSSLSIEEKEDKIRQTALTFLTNGINTPETSRDIDTYVDGNNICVKVEYSYTFILPFTQEIFGNDTAKPISYTSTYRIQP